MNQRDARSGEPVVPSSRTQQRFVEALQGLDTVVWEMDARTWLFTHVSERAERMFGYPLARWKEEGFWQNVLVDDRDRDWCTSFCLTATNESRDHAFLYRARRADGETIWLKDVVRVITDADGRPALLRGVMLDVTEEYQDRDEDGHQPIDFDDPSIATLRKMLVA